MVPVLVKRHFYIKTTIQVQFNINSLFLDISYMDSHYEDKIVISFFCHLNRPLMCWGYLRKHKNISIFSIIPGQLNNTVCRDSLSRMAITSLFHTVNIMATDDLVMQGARTSAPMVLSKCSWNIPTWASKASMQWSVKHNVIAWIILIYGQLDP